MSQVYHYYSHWKMVDTAVTKKDTDPYNISTKEKDLETRLWDTDVAYAIVWTDRRDGWNSYVNCMAMVGIKIL